jgi:hypothetical protein
MYCWRIRPEGLGEAMGKLDVQWLTRVTEKWVVCHHAGRFFTTLVHNMSTARAPLYVILRRFHFLHYTASNGSMTDERRIGKDLEGISRVPISMCLEDIRCSGRDSNRVLPQNKSTALLLDLPAWWKCFKYFSVDTKGDTCRARDV